MQHLSALAAYFNEYYVFTDICKDPAASPQNNSMGLSVYSNKLDLVGGLKALAHSIRATPSLASLGHVVFGANALINQLRDAHVKLAGGGGDYGGILKSHTLELLSSPSGPDGGGWVKRRVALALTTAADGRIIMSQLNQTGDGRPVRIRSIESREPMEWLISVIKGSLLPLPFKVCGCIDDAWIFSLHPFNFLVKPTIAHSYSSMLHTFAGPRSPCKQVACILSHRHRILRSHRGCPR